MTTSNPDAIRRYDRDYYQSQLIQKAQKDEDFRKGLVNDPKAVVAREFGVEIPDKIQITVLTEDPNQFYVVIPATASVPSELRDEHLEAVVGGASKTSTTADAGTTTDGGTSTDAAYTRPKMSQVET